MIQIQVLVKSKVYCIFLFYLLQVFNQQISQNSVSQDNGNMIMRKAHTNNTVQKYFTAHITMYYSFSGSA